MHDQANRAVTMISVASESEERAVLSNLAGWEMSAGTPVVPILDVDGFPERIRELWRSVGLRPSQLPFSQIVWCSERSASPSQPRYTRGLPDVVVASNNLDPAVRDIAAALMGAPVRDIRSLTKHESFASSSRPAVMALLTPDDMESATLAALEALTVQGGTFGIVPVENGWRGRLSTIKALTISTIPYAQGFRVINGFCDEQALKGAPTGVFGTEVALDEPLSRIPDVLLLCGHSNAWEMTVRPDLILCSREGIDQNTELPDGDGVYLPCFHGAGCPIQVKQAKGLYWRDGLTSIASLRSRVLVLWGCNLVRFGTILRRGLVFQACQSDTLAVISATEPLSGSLAEQASLLGLIAEGRPLGDVVAVMNKTLKQTYCMTTGQIGPFILFGNPNLTLRGSAVHYAAVEMTEHGIKMPIPKQSSASESGCFVRITPPESGYVSIRTKPPGVWLQGSYLSTGDCYAWVKSDPGEESSDSLTVLLDRPPDDPFEEERVALCRVRDSLLNWLILLERFKQMASDPEDVQFFTDSLAKLPAAFAMLRWISLKREPVQWRALWTWDDAFGNAPGSKMLDDIGTMSTTFLDSVLWAIRTFGADRVLQALPGIPQRGTQPEPEKPCDCGRGRLWRRMYLSGTDDSVCNRGEYQCEICDALDIDDGRRLMQLQPIQRRVQRGQTIEYTLKYTAPCDECLHIRYGAVLGRWSREEDQITGHRCDVHVPLGQSSEIVGDLTVPQDCARGSRRLFVVAIVNGWLWLAIRRLYIA